VSYLKSTTEIWDQVYNILKNDATLNAKVGTWSKQLKDAIPDNCDLSRLNFPILCVAYPSDGTVRELRIVKVDSVEKEVTYLWVVLCARVSATQATAHEMATKEALGLAERVVAIVRGNRNLSYGGNAAAELCRVDRILVRTVRSALDEKGIYGAAAVQLLVINEQ
jgi:hypothetical protein